MTVTGQDEVLVRQEGSVGRPPLNRPKALVNDPRWTPLQPGAFA